MTHNEGVKIYQEGVHYMKYYFENEERQVKKMKKNINVVFKICKFMIHIGVLLLLLVNIYILIIPLLEEHPCPDMLQKVRRKLGKQGKDA